MTVVSDAGPLIYLNLVGAIEILPRLFGTVSVPNVVLQELKASTNPKLEPVRQWVNKPPPWLEVKNPAQIDWTIKGLEAGETAAISLAQEVQADWTLIDDGEARRVAKERGLKVAGTLGVLDQAAERGLIADLPNRLERLENETPFRVGRECKAVIEDMKQRDLQRHRL